MSIIEMIILTLIAIIGTNALAWFMIWRQLNRVAEILKDDRELKDVKFADKGEW